MAETAAILIIGNEILTGKVEDQNIAIIAKEMFAIGVRLARVIVCADDIDTIVADVNALRTTHDVLFTTGGVGPTHDDLTYQAVAKAFGKPLARHAELASIIRTRFGDRVHEGHLRMADVPAGAELLRDERAPWPIIAMDNVYVFPGVPDLVRAKLPLLRDRLRGRGSFVTRSIYARCDEFTLADALATVARTFPSVTIGSYPRWDTPDHKVKLTFDGADEASVTAAMEAFLAAIAAEHVVRVE